jgi:hypothetical protein
MPTIDKIKTVEDAKAHLRDRLFTKLSSIVLPSYIPTGLQEDIIYTVGCGRYQIIVAIDANRIGKTTAIINIAKQIIWPEENEYFRFWEGENVFKEWPFSVKRFRITGTPTNLADNGAIQQAISQWWPKDKYTQEKAGKHFYSSFKCGDWEGDALTYEQSPTEYEGQTLSLVISDEPPKPALIGAINSRMAEGGIWVIGMTPLNCGVFLDTIDDLIDKGKRVKIISGSIYENDTQTGKPNHNNTKKGLWTKEQIDDYVAGIPLDEHDARVKGIASHKSGKIFPMYDDEIHSINFDNTNLGKCACYMSIDPHRQYYPAITWHAVTPGGCDVVYNEFPKHDDLKMFYDEARFSIKFTKTMEELAQIILANDLGFHGAKILVRAIDPRFHAENPGFIVRLQELGVVGWQIPDCEKIEVQRINLQSNLNFDRRIPLVGGNMPLQYVAKVCRNVRRALSRHYWEDGKDKEAEDYKDFIDAIRYRYNLTDGKIIHIEPINSNQERFHVKPISPSEAMMANRPAKGYFQPIK